MENVSTRDVIPQNLPTVSTLPHDDEHSSSSLLQRFEDSTLSSTCESVSVNDATVSGESRKSRKRPCNPSNWKSRASKMAKNSGQSGVSPKGKKFERSVMGRGCEKTCRFKCHDKITEEQRQMIFDDFLSLADHTRQWDYIARLMIAKNKEQKAKSDPTAKNCQPTYYSFPIDKDTIKVCRSMFTGTLGNN